jgi:hypothetical protein
MGGQIQNNRKIRYSLFAVRRQTSDFSNQRTATSDQRAIEVAYAIIGTRL